MLHSTPFYTVVGAYAIGFGGSRCAQSPAHCDLPNRLLLANWNRTNPKRVLAALANGAFLDFEPPARTPSKSATINDRSRILRSGITQRPIDVDDLIEREPSQNDMSASVSDVDSTDLSRRGKDIGV